VSVVGGTVQGERHQHLVPGDFAQSTPNTNGESGMGITIGGSSNVYVEGVTITQCWGDGIYQGGGYGQSSNINVYSVVADDNRRQGMSIENVNGMVIRDSTFKNTLGAWPGAGIDIEPFAAAHVVTNVQILNNQFNGNFSDGLLLENSDGTITNITINDNTANNNGYAGMELKKRGTGTTWSGNTFSGNAVFQFSAP
ncbi:MAG: right-handed parallel beta-helix repeat-containing protein, partial [Methylococcaceae bacterium]